MRSSTKHTYPDAIPPLAGVLLKRQPLARAARAEDLLATARRRTGQLLKGAMREAQGCQRLGLGLGYQAGFALAVEQLLFYLQGCRQLHARLYQRQTEQLQTTLTDLLSDADVLLRVADELAARQELFDQAPIKVLLPAAARRIAPELRRRLGEAGPRVEVGYTDAASFIVEWGEEIIEFDPADAAFRLLSEVHTVSRLDALAIDADALQRQAMLRTRQQLEVMLTKERENDAHAD